MRARLSRATLQTALAATCLAVALGARAQAPSFELAIVAPAPVRELLERHLTLGRYREVSDLDEAELARLSVLAQDEARRLLGTLGYFDPHLSLDTDASQHPPRLVLRVEPGQAAVVSETDIRFEGDIASRTDREAVAQREAIAQGTGLRPGLRFTQAAWDDAKARATRALQARRYLRGRIAASQADIDAATARAHLGLRLDSGPPFRLGPLQVTGLSRYDPRLVPRLARLPEGSDYDEERLQQAQLRLASSGYFESAFIHVDPDSDPQAAPVQVNLREAPLQKVVVGLGVSTDRGPRATLEHRHNRVPGLGWRADTRLQLERQAPSAETEWTDIPDADGWRWGVLARVERLRDTDQDTHSQRLRAGRSVSGDRIDRNVYVQWDQATVRDAAGLPLQDAGDGAALAFNYVWTRRDFDRPLQPSRGQGLSIEAGAGMTLQGERTAFQRGVVRWLQLLPLPGGRLQLRAEGGAVLAPEAARIPSTQLFRTGGDTTVRGYGFREIGVDRGGGIFGPGRVMAVGSVEWQWPLRLGGEPSPWEQAVFFDSGSVADSTHGLRPWNGVGTGVRYASPIGPLRADLAWGARTRRLRLHLNVGVTF